jgi:Tol biopolymer transport system component
MQPIEVAWSPDGATVAATNAGHYRQGYGTIMQVAAVGTAEVTTIAEGRGWVLWPDWSSDGRRLMFTWGHLGGGAGFPDAALWVYDITSGEMNQLTSDEDFSGMGVWSP